MLFHNTSNFRILLVVMMSGIPHIYDSLHMFEICDSDFGEDNEISNEEYEELCEKIEEHILEDEKLLKRIMGLI